jgi:cytochrome c553
MEYVMNRQNSGALFLLITLATILTLSALLVTSACGSGSKMTASATTPSALGVSFSKEIQPIFNNYCVVCHQGAGQAGLTLEPNLSYTKLVGVPSTESTAELRVKPGSPDQSYIIAKLQGTQVQAGGSGAQMPYGAAPLAQAQISLIQQWIAEGAPNN